MSLAAAKEIIVDAAVRSGTFMRAGWHFCFKRGLKNSTKSFLSGKDVFSLLLTVSCILCCPCHWFEASSCCYLVSLSVSNRIDLLECDLQKVRPVAYQVLLHLSLSMSSLDGKGSKSSTEQTYLLLTGSQRRQRFLNSNPNPGCGSGCIFPQWLWKWACFSWAAAAGVRPCWINPGNLEIWSSDQNNWCT